MTGHVEGLRRYRPIVVGLVRKQGACPPNVPVLLPRSPAERLSLTVAGRAGALGRRLAAERPSLIHAHFGTDGLIALPLAEKLGVPRVRTGTVRGQPPLPSHVLSAACPGIAMPCSGQAVRSEAPWYSPLRRRQR